MQPLETDSARSARVSLLIQAEEIVNCSVGVRGVCTRGEKEIAIPERIARVFPGSRASGRASDVAAGTVYNGYAIWPPIRR
jgi:hypothetical protein